MRGMELRMLLMFLGLVWACVIIAIVNDALETLEVARVDSRRHGWTDARKQ